MMVYNKGINDDTSISSYKFFTFLFLATRSNAYGYFRLMVGYGQPFPCSYSSDY
jgi:hypothetical protein